MELVAYKGKDSIGDRFIQSWTGEIYSHCELRVAGTCYSSSIRDNGVRSKAINVFTDNWDIYPLTKFSESEVLSYYYRTRYQKYSYFDLVFSQMLNTKFNNPRAPFCSEWCAEALLIPNGRIYSPTKLVELVKYIEGMK